MNYLNYVFEQLVGYHEQFDKEEQELQGGEWSGVTRADWEIWLLVGSSAFWEP